MKLETIQEFVKGKDLTNQSTQQELVDLINSETNSLIKTKKESFAKEMEEQKAKLAEANLNSKKFQSDIESLSSKISEQEALANKLNTKLYISNKSKGKLDDQAMNDVITLANSRVTETKNKEQAIDEVLSLYFNKEEAPKAKPKVSWTSSSPSNNVSAKLMDSDLKSNLNPNKQMLDTFKNKVGINKTNKNNLFKEKL